MCDRKPPNIVFILADDLGSWGLGCYGNKEIHTPHLDRLAAEGAKCLNFFCSSPVCSPARASILTGRIPSQHGIHDWIRSGNLAVDALPQNLQELFPEERVATDYLAGQATYTQILSDAGYNCALSGKWHLGNSAVPQQGFDRWFTIAAGGCSYMKPSIVDDGQVCVADEYITTLITDRALEFLNELQPDEKPFYLGVHYTAPHSPWERSEHPEEYLALYDSCPFLSTPNLPRHPWQNADATQGYDGDRNEILRGYFAAVTAMDEGIGQILQRLDATGHRESTLVVFLSDNGMNMGHHGVWGKGNGTRPMNCWDTSVKIPAIFSQPGVIASGSTIDELLSQYDLFQTIMEYTLAGSTVTPGLPGSSFCSLLKRSGPWSRSDVVVYDEYGPVRMIRTAQWKYIHRYPYGPHELFDLANDPDEELNRVGDEAVSGVRDELRARLGTWYAKYVDPTFDGIYAAVTGDGQWDLALPGMREGKSFRRL